MRQLVIIGASGHGKVVADIAKKNGYTDIVFLDDDADIRSCGGYPVIGKTKDSEIMDADLFVAIGNAMIRRRIMNECGKCVTLIHPSAIIADSVEIGEGTVIMAGAVINPDVKIGKGCIINTCASVDHDCVLGDYVHVSVGAHISGTVRIGEETWIGAGATISNNVSIVAESCIGAGAVVVKDICECGTYIGVPAKLLRDRIK